MNKIYTNIELSQCICIWRAVLNQALSDALNGNNLSKKTAIKWFFGDDKDFYRACNWAQISPGKLRYFLIKKLAAEGPDVIKNCLYEKTKKGTYPRISKAFSSIPRIQTTSSISFLYENLEMRANIIDNKLWFNLSHLNHTWKFSALSDVFLQDVNTRIDPDHLKSQAAKSKNPKSKKLILFTDITGIIQLAKCLDNSKLESFATWVKNKKYKQYLLPAQDIFKLKFQNHTILARLYRNKLFILFNDIQKIFLLITSSYRKIVHQNNKYFYSYMNSPKRQLVIRSDLLLQIVESRNVAKKKYQEIKPQLIQWIKEQQSRFEEENNEE